ncbi:MAG: helix-turn-helix domain-containing protein [Clostridia bacterium]|nr:helix-turn-helix domain-containing protein [Clostridia bacterium]MBQ5716197.1 helix-turn-helix domain-containing protein [Clostridia bacterium]
MPALRKNKDQIREIEIKKLFTAALLDKGWSQKHLAKLLGMDSGNLNRTINHPLKREFHTLLRIADKLGVNLGEALLKSN